MKNTDFLFKKYNLPFAIYATTGFIERRSVLWWILLEELVVSRKKISFDLGGKTYDFFCRSLSEKECAFNKIHALFMQYQGNRFMEAAKVILEKARLLEIKNDSDKLLMKQVKDLYTKL